MKNLVRVSLWVIIASSLISCSINAESTLQPQVVPQVTPPNTPEASKATVIGRVLDEKSGEPLADTIIRLALVVRQGGEGAYVLDVAFSPDALTDKDGYFIIENLDPQECVIIVGDVYSTYKVITGEDQKPKPWKVEAGKILDVGTLKVSL